MTTAMRNVFYLATSVSPLLVLHPGNLGGKSFSIRRDYLVSVRLHLLLFFFSFTFAARSLLWKRTSQTFTRHRERIVGYVVEYGGWQQRRKGDDGFFWQIGCDES